MIHFRLELIGGPFDGERGLGWVDDGEHEPPKVIHVGKCSWPHFCGEADCPGLDHVWFWAPECDGELPLTGLVPYARADVEVTGHLRGVARYVCSQGVDLATVLETFEAVPTGAMAWFEERRAELWARFEWISRQWNDYIGGRDGD